MHIGQLLRKPTLVSVGILYVHLKHVSPLESTFTHGQLIVQMTLHNFCGSVGQRALASPLLLELYVKSWRILSQVPLLLLSSAHEIQSGVGNVSILFQHLFNDLLVKVVGLLTP